jgi:outer membrane lipoprotein SlyB
MNSSNVYRTSETNRAMSTAACSVAQARYVALVDDSQASQNRDTVNQGVGVVAGALIGHAIGSEIGGGSGNVLAKQLGTIAGGVAGSSVADNVNASRKTMTGVEYTVNLGSKGYRTIVQSLNAGEEPIKTGASCTVVGSGKTLRVLPI